MSPTTTTVLLHGAGTGAWVWEDVIQRMKTPVLALEVPGRQPGVTPGACAEALVAELDRRGIGAVVLVAHSLAGVLVPDLAERLGTRLRHCVYLAAVVPPPGGAFVDALGLVQRLLLRLLFAFKPRGLKPGAAMIRQELCNDLEPSMAELVISRYAAEFPGLYLAPTAATPAPGGASYIKLLKDQSLPPALQDRMVARLRQPRLDTLDAGHLAMLSAPQALARKLDQLVARFPPPWPERQFSAPAGLQQPAPG
ncbi:alpha/beta hydrolase [Paucibacter sp. O1-1]|nr:alpha/beta hydrolase [Paucibacter sp. O1-1]MDA3829321.1 alpha/beta hydrolase [Paucibacter sp. O1-1]